MSCRSQFWLKPIGRLYKLCSHAVIARPRPLTIPSTKASGTVTPETIHQGNFHLGTHGMFTHGPQPERPPDYVSDSGSRYWFSPAGVYRLSNHWAGQHGCTGQRSCLWQIDVKFQRRSVIGGYCRWDAFKKRSVIRKRRKLKPPRSRRVDAESSVATKGHRSPTLSRDAVGGLVPGSPLLPCKALIGQDHTRPGATGALPPWAVDLLSRSPPISRARLKS